MQPAHPDSAKKIRGWQARQQVLANQSKQEFVQEVNTLLSLGARAEHTISRKSRVSPQELTLCVSALDSSAPPHQGLPEQLINFSSNIRLSNSEDASGWPELSSKKRLEQRSTQVKASKRLAAIKINDGELFNDFKHRQCIVQPPEPASPPSVI